MKKLFTVNGKLFSNKPDAKVFRDELNKAQDKTVFTVSYGPDHIGKHGEQPYPTMRRQPK